MTRKLFSTERKNNQLRTDKPQRGNPHELVVRQHVFPRASIERFAEAQGHVQVHKVAGGKVFLANASNDIFCAHRIWDQKAEQGLMKRIEDAFQSIADQIFAGSLVNLEVHQNDAISEFFSLWKLRHERRLNPIEDEPVNGLSANELTIDQQEILESKHTMFVKPDGTFPGRFISGIQFLRELDFARADMAGRQWAILTAGDGEFIAPDNFGNYALLPLSPSIMLAAGHEHQVLELSRVTEINTLAVECSAQYFFARDLEKTPRLKVPHLPRADG